jgi:hypothetical protein
VPRKTSEWQSEPAPKCPNNIRHGLVPSPDGGWVCEECKDAHKPRSKTAYRFAFALDRMIDTPDTE